MRFRRPHARGLARNHGGAFSRGGGRRPSARGVTRRRQGCCSRSVCVCEFGRRASSAASRASARSRSEASAELDGAYPRRGGQPAARQARNATAGRLRRDLQSSNGTFLNGHRVGRGDRNSRRRRNRRRYDAHDCGRIESMDVAIRGDRASCLTMQLGRAVVASLRWRADSAPSTASRPRATLLAHRAPSANAA